MKTAKGTILHNNWDEKPYHEAAPLKSTEAKIDIVMNGDIEATGPGRYLMHYPNDATCHYSGYLVMDGTVDGKAGQFIVCEIGDWTNGVASSKWQIVKNSGTGALKGITGHGSYAAEHDKTVHYELSYDL